MQNCKCHCHEENILPKGVICRCIKHCEHCHPESFPKDTKEETDYIAKEQQFLKDVYDGTIFGEGENNCYPHSTPSESWEKSLTKFINKQVNLTPREINLFREFVIETLSEQRKEIEKGLNFEQMVKEIDELVSTDFMFDMDCKGIHPEEPFTHKQSQEMANILTKVYSIAHCITCKACQTKYLINPNHSQE